MFQKLNLSYNFLPANPPEPEPPEDSSNEFGDVQWKQHPRKLSYCLTIKAAVVIFIFILQLGFTLHFQQAASRCARGELDKPQTFEARFESDRNYQSLDHRYDNLWNETGQSPIVMTSIGLNGGQAQVGSITM